MQNQTQIFGIRAIIEAINSGETIDKVFLQKGLHGELFSELETLLRKNSINSSYVPVEKLNRLTKKTIKVQLHKFHQLNFMILKHWF